MLKRLVVGLILGAVIGAGVAAVLVQGLGVQLFAGAVMSYLAAAVTGAITGLVAGKPIWSADGKIEAGLKAFFGVLLGLGGMFVLRQWVHVNLDLTAIKAGAGEIGSLPAASLPAIAAILATFFELDNTSSAEGDDEKKNDASGDKQLASGKKVRVGAQKDEADDDGEEPAVAKKKS